MINSFNQGHPSVFNVKWPLDFDYPAAIRSKIAVYLVFICLFFAPPLILVTFPLFGSFLEAKKEVGRYHRCQFSDFRTPLGRISIFFK